MRDDSTDSRSFLEQVEAFFVSSIRRGLSLRSSDVDIARDWDRRGVPMEVVRRGISEGIRRFLATAEPHAPLPGVLRYYRTFVEAEFQAWRRARSQGIGPGVKFQRPSVAVDLVAVAMEILATWKMAASGDAERTVYESAAAMLLERATREPAGALLELLDDDIARGLIAALPAVTREKVLAEIKVGVAAARARGVGAEALGELECAEMRCAAAREAGFRSLVDATLERGPEAPT